MGRQLDLFLASLVFARRRASASPGALVVWPWKLFPNSPSRGHSSWSFEGTVAVASGALCSADGRGRGAAGPGVRAGPAGQSSSSDRPSCKKFIRG